MGIFTRWCTVYMLVMSRGHEELGLSFQIDTSYFGGEI